jgi:hypothetical protein
MVESCQHLTEYPHHEGAQQSPLPVHDVAANLPSSIRITKAPTSLLGIFMEKIEELRQYHDFGRLNYILLSHLLLTEAPNSIELIFSTEDIQEPAENKRSSIFLIAST